MLVNSKITNELFFSTAPLQIGGVLGQFPVHNVVMMITLLSLKHNACDVIALIVHLVTVYQLSAQRIVDNIVITVIKCYNCM